MINHKVAGIAGAMLSAITFGLNPLFALKLYAEGLSTPTVLFFRFCIGAGMIALLMGIKRQSFALPRKNLPHILLLGVCLASTSLGLFLSFRFMDAGIASTILFTYPVMVAVIMGVFFKEKISPVLVLSIILSLAGILIMSKNSDGAYLDIRGVLLALLSAFAYAVYMVIVKQSKVNAIPSEAITFYAMLFSLPYFCFIPDFSFYMPLNEYGIVLNMFGLAFFPSLLSFYFLAIGLKNIGATKTAIIGALEPLTAVCIGIFVFGEDFTWQLAAGIVMVLGGVMLVILSDKLKELSAFKR